MMRDNCYLQKLELIRQKYGYQRPQRSYNQNNRSSSKDIVGQFSQNVQLHKRNRIEQITKLKRQFNLSSNKFSEPKKYEKNCPQNYTTRVKEPLKQANSNIVDRNYSNSKINTNLRKFQATATIDYNKSSTATNIMNEYLSNLGNIQEVKNLKKSSAKEKLDSKYLRQKAKMTRSRILSIPQSKQIQISETLIPPNYVKYDQQNIESIASTTRTHFSSSNRASCQKQNKKCSRTIDRNMSIISHSIQTQISDSWNINSYENVQQKIKKFLNKSRR